MTMDRVWMIRAASLYLPITMAMLLWCLRRPARAERAGILLALVWNASALLALNMVALQTGWWQFAVQRALFLGTPVEFYLGWTVLWGMVPQLAFPGEPLAVAVASMAAFDLVFMPRLAPLLALGPEWWMGEVVGLAFALLPSLLIARWTARQEQLYGRAAMQFLTFAGLTLWLLPSVIFAARGRPWPAPGRSFLVFLQLVCLAGAPGVAAVHEFATRGRGTPLPYDPPKRLTTTGPYAYLANPMQFAAMVTLVLWGLALRSGWVAAAGAMAHIYSIGLASWDERADLGARFGEPWHGYRKQVRNWLPRWRPYVAAPATLYVAETCGMCSQIKRWFEGKRSVGLAIRAAETYPGRLTRITYVHAGGSTESGVAAAARAVEHIHLGWAYLGWCARLPVVNQALQLLVDACGGEAREMPGFATDCHTNVSSKNG